jgi:hypothetical protein
MLRSERENEGPAPSTPSRLDVQLSEAETSPLSTSLAVAENWIGVPSEAIVAGRRVLDVQERCRGGHAVEGLGGAAAGARHDQHDRISARPAAGVDELLEHRREVRRALGRVLLADHAPRRRRPGDGGDGARSHGHAVRRRSEGRRLRRRLALDRQRRRARGRLVGLELHPGLLDERARWDRHARKSHAHELHVRAVGHQLEVAARDRHLARVHLLGVVAARRDADLDRHRGGDARAEREAGEAGEGGGEQAGGQARHSTD